MSDFIKRQNVAFYLSVIAFILTLVGIILAGVSSSVQGYALTSLGAIMACSIIALVLIVAGIILADKLGSQNWLTCIVYVAAMVLLMVAFCNLIGDRAVLASAQFSYDSVNTTGWTVLYESIVGLVMILISAVLLMVGAFFKDKKKA